MKHASITTAAALLTGCVLSAQSTVTWDVANANDNWNTSDANWTGGASFTNGDLAVFDDAAGETVQIDAGGVNPGSTTIDDGDFRFEGGSIGSGSLNLNSSGTTVLTQSNSFSGVDLSAGNLRIQNVGSLGAGTLTHSGGELLFSFGNGSTSTVANDFVLNTTGQPTFVIRGTDGAAPSTETTVRLTGAISGGAAGQTYRMGDTLAGGNMNSYLILDNAANTFAGNVQVFRGFVGVTSDGALGAVDNDVNLAVGSFGGGLRFAADNVSLNSDRDVIFNGNEIIDTGAFTASIAGDFSENGTNVVRKTGAGTLIFTGTSTVTGTSITEGTLQIGDGGTTGALGSGTITNDATLVLDRSDNFNLNNKIDGGSGELIKRGAGTMTMATNTDVKNSALTIEEGRVVSQKGTRYFAIGHLVGGSGLANGATITIENGAAFDIDGNENLDGSVAYGLGARGNVQVVLNGGAMNFLEDASFRSNAVGTFTSNNGGSVTVENNHRLDLNNSGGFTTTGNGATNVSGGGSLNLLIRNTSGDEPVFDVGADAPLTIDTDITSINVNNSGGGLGIEKTGTGTLTLNGFNTYAGNTTVTAGTLLVNGTVNNVSVASGATLGGSGQVGDLTVTGGTLAPGNSAGVLETGNLSLDASATFAYEFGLTASDRVEVDGDLSLGGATLFLSDLATGTISLGDSLTLFGYTGTWDGSTFDGLANESEFSGAGFNWEIVYDSLTAGSLNGGSGSSFVTLTAVVPEPSAGAALLGLVAGALACLLRRPARHLQR